MNFTEAMAMFLNLNDFEFNFSTTVISNFNIELPLVVNVDFSKLRKFLDSFVHFENINISLLDDLSDSD